jgi:hypothetical protein
MFSSAIWPSTPKRSATARTRSGRNVPLVSSELEQMRQAHSVSMYATLPLAPPWSSGSWVVTQRVWHSWVCISIKKSLINSAYLASTELAVNFGDTLRRDTATEHPIDSLGSRGDCQDVLAALRYLGSGREGRRLG